MARIASMSVYDKATGREIVKGDILRTANGAEYRLVSAAKPTVPGKSGTVWVHLTSERLGTARTLYAHIFGVVVKGRMDCGCPVGLDDPGHLDTCKEA